MLLILDPVLLPGWGGFGGLFFLLLLPRPQQHRCPRKVLPLHSPLLCPFVSLSPFPSLSFVYLFFLPAIFSPIFLFVFLAGRRFFFIHLCLLLAAPDNAH